MNRERVVKIIQEWLPMTHRTVYELADRIIAEEGKDRCPNCRGFGRVGKAGCCLTETCPLCNGTGNNPIQPQQPKAEEEPRPMTDKEYQEWNGGGGTKTQQPKAEEGKESPFIEPTNTGDPFPYRKSRATSKLKKQPQQPKLPEKLPEFLMEIDRHGLYKKTINEILDYLKAREI